MPRYEPIPRTGLRPAADRQNVRLKDCARPSAASLSAFRARRCGDQDNPIGGRRGARLSCAHACRPLRLRTLQPPFAEGRCPSVERARRAQGVPGKPAPDEPTLHRSHHGAPASCTSTSPRHDRRREHRAWAPALGSAIRLANAAPLDHPRTLVRRTLEGRTCVGSPAELRGSLAGHCRAPGSRR
jgi:hypothetical protein